MVFDGVIIGQYLTLGSACHFLSQALRSCKPPFDLRNISYQNSLITIAIVLVLYSIKLFRYFDIKVFERYSVDESREPSHLEYVPWRWKPVHMVAFLHTDDWRINWLTRLTEQSPYVPLKGGSNALCLFPSWSLIFVSFRFCLEAGFVRFRFLPILTMYNGWNAEHSRKKQLSVITVRDIYLIRHVNI